jgi:hypothetical protein
MEEAETTIIRLLCTAKATGHVDQCSYRIYREINVSSRFEYRMFCFISIFDLFTYSRT